MAENPQLKYYADWDQPQGKSTKKSLKVHIHPFDLISFVHRRDGLDKACELALQLINNKYKRLFEASKAKLD